MKIVKSKERDGKDFLYSFDLDKCFYPQDCRPGFLILYTLVTGDDFPTERIIIDHWGDIHGGRVRDTYSRKLFMKRFPTFREFCQEQNQSDMGPWMISLLDGTTVSGEADTVIKVRAQSDAINFTRLFLGVEDATYSMSEFPSAVLGYLQNREGTTLRSAVQILSRLGSHPDLYNEFCGSVQSGAYVAAEHPIVVEGFTAERLVTEKGYRPAGAYNTLADLMEDPKKTLALIERGFVRK